MKYRIQRIIESDGLWYYPQKKKWWGWSGTIGAKTLERAKEIIDDWISGKEGPKKVQIIEYPPKQTVQDY